jgi:hypothetical protein
MDMATGGKIARQDEAPSVGGKCALGNDLGPNFILERPLLSAGCT